MYEFEVKREWDVKKLRKVSVSLMRDGKVVDKTWLFGYAPLLGLRIKLRKMKMLRLNDKIIEANE